jgi:F-type H+-transporting ATPase subunit epsilon
MAKTFNLEIITPERLFYEGVVEMVIVRTLLGYEGFLANHSWACNLLDTGILRIKEAGAKEFKVAAITGGFIDVKDQIVIFTDAAEWPEEIDVDRQQRKIQEAEQRLKACCGDDQQIQLAKISIAKAVNRMNVKSGGGRRSR